MVTREDKQWVRESTAARPRAKRKVSPLRKRMIRDMELAGLAGNTQQTYIRAVLKLQDHCHIRPDPDGQGWAGKDVDTTDEPREDVRDGGDRPGLPTRQTARGPGTAHWRLTGTCVLHFLWRFRVVAVALKHRVELCLFVR